MKHIKILQKVHEARYTLQKEVFKECYDFKVLREYV